MARKGTDVVLAVFNDRERADDAISALEDRGYNAKDISVVMKDEEGKTRQTTGDNVGSGAATGAVVGGIAGLIIGVSAIAIPGIGPIVVGGPLAAALGATGAAAATGAVTGALAGGLIGGLIGLGVPEEEARVYEEEIRRGGILLATPATVMNSQEVERVLTNNGARHVKSVVMELPHGHAPIDTLDIQRYISDVNYPATRTEIVRHADEKGAETDIKTVLGELPDKRYDSAAEVNREIRAAEAA
jgi:uncharacterized membrane protein